MPKLSFSKVANLPISIREHQAERPPRRRLELNCQVANPTEFDICIVDAWIKVEVFNGLKLAEGRLFHTMHNRVDPAIIPARKSGLGAVSIELPGQVIQCIEDRRAGGDVTLRLSSRVLISKICTANRTKVLGVPFETSFGNEHGGYVEYLIPQSEWIKILKSLAWSELELVEFPIGLLRSIPSLVRALQRFEAAQDCYRRGDWDEALVNCRKVFEAIVKDTTGKDDMAKAPEAFRFIIDVNQKADYLSDAVKAFSTFLHLGRHENLPAIPITRADAQLALQFTGAFLVYLGGHEHPRLR